MFRLRLLAIVILAFLLVVSCTEKGDKSEPLTNEKNPPLEIATNSEIPPRLTIEIGTNTIRAIRGGYNWSYYDEVIDEMTYIEAEALPPPELVNIDQAIDVNSDSPVQLLFGDPPLEYKVRIWNAEKAVGSLDELIFAEQKGNIIFEILANWEQGTASYAFTVNIN